MSSTAKSVPTAHSTPAQPPSANSAAQAKTTESADQPIGKENPAAEAPKSRMVFPLLLTVVAVLPIAFGFGAVRLNGSVSHPEASALAHTESPKGDSPVELHPHDRRIGDREFFERRYEVALKYYRSLGSPNPDRLPSELLYRIALCQEALGLWDDALVSLRSVSESAQSPLLRVAATYGQARIWFRLNSPEQAESLLRSLEFHSELAARIPRFISRDIAFLIPLSMAQKSVDQIDKGASFPISQLLTWSLETAIGWADEQNLEEAADQDHESPVANTDADPIQCRVRRPTTDISSEFLAGEWTIDLSCHGQSVRQVVEKVAQNCGWVIDWSELKQDESLRQTVNIDVKNRPVWVLLTSICSELRATWSIEKDQLRITRLDPEGVRTRQMIARTLGSLATWLPNHRLVSPARYAEGQLAQSHGELVRAAEIFSSLTGRDSSVVAIRSAYNAAYDYYRLGDYRRASVQLMIVIDGAPEQNLYVEALILLGRLLMDRGEMQEAVFQLRRAMDSRSLPDQQARAAILLGLAFLMQEKYEEAAETVFSRRTQLEEPALRFAASFVTSFSRWQVLTDENKEREAPFLYRSIAAVKNDSEWLGQSGQLLIGRAYNELGLEDLMADLYSHMLTNGVTEFIETEITYSLANYEQAAGHNGVAMQLWLKLSDGPANRWKERSKIKRAELALTAGQFKEVIAICEQAQPADGVTQGEILKLMGRAYEELGEHLLAARCYAGQQPKR